MSRVIKVIILTLVLLLTLMTAACGKSEETTTVTSTAPKITLDDAPTVLDISESLPSNFTRLDATEEGMPDVETELGEDVSEAQVFISEDPVQFIYSYYIIIESQSERAEADAVFNDEEQVKSLVVDNLLQGLSEGGSDVTDINLDITYPQVGDLAILGKGAVTFSGTEVMYDILIFKVEKVYVFLLSAFLSDNEISLEPLGQVIENNIKKYSQ